MSLKVKAQHKVALLGIAILAAGLSSPANAAGSLFAPADDSPTGSANVDPIYDSDFDGVANDVDNCPVTLNPSQADFDGNGIGDHCDLGDGMIYLQFNDPHWVEWQDEAGFSRWNAYRGDLSLLPGTLAYVQQPGSNDLAAEFLDLPAPLQQDHQPILPGGVAYYLVTGSSGTGECSLGETGSGDLRTPFGPCYGNKAVNGDFEAGANPWTFWTDSAGTYNVVNGEARLDITTQGENVQLYQRHVELVPNAQYRLTFRARSTGGHDVWIRFSEHLAPFAPYGLNHTVNLSSTDRTYTIDFTTTSDTGPDGRLMFHVGYHDQDGDVYFFDDVTLNRVP